MGVSMNFLTASTYAAVLLSISAAADAQARRGDMNTHFHGAIG